MIALLDTSVLVAALVQAHPEHSRAIPWLQRASAGSVTLCVSSHSLAETYAVLTALPASPRIPPALARRVIRESVEPAAEIVPLTSSDYRRALDHVAHLGLAGGVVYDALIAWAAQKRKVDRLVTLDPHDFRRVWPEGADRIVPP